MRFPNDDAEPRRRCTESDVNPEWWLEPDIDPSDFGEESGLDQLSLYTEYGRAMQEVRRNQARAKLHCYECPFLAECRENSWDEPAHVFAGLDANERYTARSAGKVALGSASSYKRVRKSLGVREKVVATFLEGLSVDAIAATLSCNTENVWYHIKGALAQARVRWEEQLCQESAPPSLPRTVSRQAFRTGSLVRNGLLGPELSSDFSLTSLRSA